MTEYDSLQLRVKGDVGLTFVGWESMRPGRILMDMIGNSRPVSLSVDRIDVEVYLRLGKSYSNFFLVLIVTGWRPVVSVTQAFICIWNLVELSL